MQPTVTTVARSKLAAMLRDLPAVAVAAEVGLSSREIASYSLRDELQRLLSRDPVHPVAHSSLEREASEAIAARVGRRPRGELFVPQEVLTRALSTSPGSKGGYAVPVELGPGDTFIDALRAASIVSALGVQELGPLEGGGATFPRVKSGPTVVWQPGDGSSTAASDPVIGQQSATPRTVLAYTQVSEQLLRQAAPVVDAFLMRNLGGALGAAVDTAVTSGTGASGQPLGIANTSGVDASAASSMTWANVLAQVYAVKHANGVVNQASTGFAGAPDVEQTLAGRERFTGAGAIWNDGTIHGRPAFASNSLAAASMIFGDWSQVIVCHWGLLEIGVKTGGSLFDSFAAGVRAHWTVDVVVLNPESFSVRTSIS